MSYCEIKVNHLAPGPCSLRFPCCGKTLTVLFQFTVVQEGELDAIAVVHSYEDAMPPGSHKTRLTALNVCFQSNSDIISFPFLKDLLMVRFK